ncbi:MULTISPECIES: hypothetical protein [unclassified Neptuniibacter]|uniref:hypothetical protein n=1 Tax=unclassified Neptuniibacter TaxID=2630693 RepID=UPI000C69ED6F|nr:MULTISPECIES: hypothetical protein [unclassified Neptuniibacter]MAY42884.1 hypothetical protein [Oceanospirillaceae bacterium]
MNRATLIRLLLIPALSIPTAMVEASSQNVWKDGINYIAINSDAMDNQNNHPYEIESKKLARILSHIKIESKDKKSLTSLISFDSEKKVIRVFTAKEIDVLAQGISKALEQSKKNEVVTFSVSDFRNVYFGDKRLSISGTAFIKNENLNLLFGEIHVDFHKKYVRSGQGVSNSRFASNVELSNFKLSTGNTSKEQDHDWQLKVFSGANSVNNRSDWLSINLAQQYDYQESQAQTEVIQNKYLSESQKAQQVQQPSDIEERLKRLEAATATTAATASKTPTESVDSVEARLRKVKALYEDGIIPESVYLQKMNAIISEL